MTERVEELRGRYRNHGCSGDKCTDTCIVLTALAQAERERDNWKADFQEACRQREQAEAEVERLKADYVKKELDAYSDRAEEAEAALASVRAALDRARGEIGILRDAVRRKDDTCAALHRTLETIRDVEVATRAPCYLALIEAALAGRG